MNPYQAFKDTGSVGSHTGCNIPQLVLEFAELQGIGDVFGAEVYTSTIAG